MFLISTRSSCFKVLLNKAAMKNMGTKLDGKNSLNGDHNFALKPKPSRCKYRFSVKNNRGLNGISSTTHYVLNFFKNSGTGH